VREAAMEIVDDHVTPLPDDYPPSTAQTHFDEVPDGYRGS